MDSFGDETLPITHEWPTKEQLKQLPLEKRIKLNRISFNNDANILSAFRLSFTSRVKSQIFASDTDRTELFLKYIDVDETRHIRKVSILVNDEFDLKALKLIDANDKIIAQLGWYTDEGECWVTKDIPEGKEIIGFYCNTEGLYINRLGFILWTPPYNAQ